jgi:DNA-binding transcriptional LysR family regulator
VFLELRQLEHFIAVAEEQSFTKAARRAHIVQPGLSMSIKTLERELGGDLFIRSPNRVTLTSAGKALLPEARRAVAAVRGAADAVAETHGLLRGTLTIGSSMPLLPVAYDLPSMLRRFSQAYPKVRIEVRQESSAELLGEVRAGMIDLGFVTTDGGPLPAGIRATVLARSPMMLVCSKAHRLAKRRSVDIEELSSEPFIDVSSDFTSRRMVDAMFDSAGIVRDTRITITDISFFLAFVEQGLGVAVIPNVVSRFPSNVRYVPLTGRHPAWHLICARSDTHTPSAAARALEEFFPAPVTLKERTWSAFRNIGSRSRGKRSSQKPE